MTLQVSIKVRGDRELRAALEAIERPRIDRVFENALSRAAKEVRDETRTGQLSGQLLAVRTGELRASIEVDPTRLPRAVKIGSALEQAPPLHFGWPAKNIRARPFLERGLDQASRRFEGFLYDALDGEVPR